jgi:hypothetical protein
VGCAGLLVVIEMKEYDILFETGEVGKLVSQLDRMAKDGSYVKWMAIEIFLGQPLYS